MLAKPLVLYYLCSLLTYIFCTFMFFRLHLFHCVKYTITIPYMAYYAIPYHAIPYHTYHTIHGILCHTIPCHTIPYIPYHTWHTMPYHTMPYHTIHTIPYMAYYAIPYHMFSLIDMNHGLNYMYTLYLLTILLLIQL